ncbi:MAG: hypothetical protein K2P84_13480, partial [Undibacterium sp.]|nr:hypothetical protein [Undibacterium sp.]
PFGHVKLLCDGYSISLVVERQKNLTYRVMTYVNGCFKGLWCTEKNQAPESKFLRKVVKPHISPKKRQQLEKQFGKRFVQKDAFCNGSSTFFMPDWASGKAALNHLCKVCESIKLVE